MCSDKCENLGKRINIDELAKQFGGNQDPYANIHAGRTAMNLISKYIEEGTSFHIETTLPGAAMLRHINSAKEHGFTVVLYYIGIDDINVAIERVHQRMANGGHGIADQFIIKRFSQLNHNLRAALPRYAMTRYCLITPGNSGKLRFWKTSGLSTATGIFPIGLSI